MNDNRKKNNFSGGKRNYRDNKPGEGRSKSNDERRSSGRSSFGKSPRRDSDAGFSRRDDDRPRKKREFSSDKEGGSGEFRKKSYSSSGFSRRDDDRPRKKREFSSDKEGGSGEFRKKSYSSSGFSRRDDDRPRKKREFFSDKEGGSDEFRKKSYSSSGFSRRDGDRPRKKREFSSEKEVGSGEFRKKSYSSSGFSRGEEGEKKFSSRNKKHDHKKKFREEVLELKSKEKSDEIRLNKYISNAGICSRREADNLIKAGAVTVNGKVVSEMGYKVKPGDVVNYGGGVIKSERKVYILLNKPKDYITTMDDERGRSTVMELIKDATRERVYPVGRLDRNTTGLLLFTNDGELTDKLTHPKHEVKKIYQVTLDKNLKGEDFQQIVDGMELEDGPVKVDDIQFVGDGKSRREVGIEIHSGRNRIVRRIFEQLGYEVIKLDRVFFAGLTKKDLPRGRWRLLSEKEVGWLKMLG